MPFLFALAWLAAVLAGAMPAHAQAVRPATGSAASRPTHLAAELVAAPPQRAGAPATLALHFRPAPGWHGYWANPGDAGFPMRLDWRLPAGWQVGEPTYPVPQTLLQGALMNHIYARDYAVLLPLDLPAGAQAADIAVTADWLACTDAICVPEHAVLTARLDPRRPADMRVARWRAAIAPRLDRAANAALADGALQLAVPLPAAQALGVPHVFLRTENVVDNAGPQRFRRAGDMLVAEVPLAPGAALPPRIEGILAFDGAGGGADGDTGVGAAGVRFVAVPGPVPAGGTPLDAAAGAQGGASGWGYAWLLLGALAGGLVLNIMPCVFPILSLKAISLARAGESAGQARAEGLAYSAGVIVATTGLGAGLLALRAGGEQVGWAFQLQQPGVVAALGVLAALIAANFAGLFELPGLPIRRGGQPAGAFATGLLAAFAATPCTGPFMAAAMGAALLLPVLPALALFAALGFGLALPFLLLGFVPRLRAMLPRPGRWMERFRQAMAVPMALTAAALLWLGWRLGGTDLAGAMAVLMALALLFAGIYGARQRRRFLGFAPLAAGLAAIAGIGWLLVPTTAAGPGAAEPSLLSPRPFSEAALAQARASGRPVFVWFTADWCLSCKVNEGIAIERTATADAFAAAGVVALRGDWTRADPAITDFLTRQGAAGVPLYLWYPPGAAPAQLPQVLTPATLPRLAAAAARTGSAAAPGDTGPALARAKAKD